MRKFLIATVFFFGAGDGMAQATLNTELATLLGWIAGEFDNRQQVVHGENFLLESKPEPSDAPDLLFPVFAQVEAPALGANVIYLQWPIGSPEGRLQRQRIWTFAIDEKRNALVMDFFTLRDPDRWRDAHLKPNTALRDITREDLIPYPAACRLPFRRHADVFIGEIRRGECRIISQQTRTDMTINARVVIARDQIWYQEYGVRQDGSVVFKVPVAGSYQFKRR